MGLAGAGVLLMAGAVGSKAGRVRLAAAQGHEACHLSTLD